MPESGNYGTPGNPQEIWSSYWQLQWYTGSDPAHVEGDFWGRSDLDSGDKIATVRFDNGNTVDDIPVFPDGTDPDSNDVENVARVPTPNGRGWIPIASQHAAYNHLAYIHGGTRYGLHDDLIAIPDSVVDNFEEVDADPPGFYREGETVADYYDGETEHYQRQQSTVNEGDYALEATGDNAAIMDDGGEFALSTDTTWNFAMQHTSSDADGSWLWMCQDETGRSPRTCYEANVRSNQGDIRVVRYDNGSGTIIDQAGATIPTNEWMRGEVEHLGDGSITFSLFDSNDDEIAQVSGTDTTYTSGGHGFSNFNADLVWDNVREV